MGPQHHCCGMYAPEGIFMNQRLLQWGRNITAAECMSLADQLADNILTLQWGRNITAAECLYPCQVRLAIPRFNGAATSLLRNVAGSTRPCIPGCVLQWGRNITAAE